jgi:hypothetical protein
MYGIRRIINGAVMGAGGATAKDVTLSQSNTIKTRNEAREKAAADIYASFQPPEYAVSHWDVKQLAWPEEKLAERLAVLVSGNTKECRQGKLLASYALDSGTSAKQTEECIQLIKLWNLYSCIDGPCFDTPATKTGRLQGTSVAVEKHLGCKLLYHACQHHCHELFLRDVWEMLFGKDQGPTYTPFKNLQSTWDKLEKTTNTPFSALPVHESMMEL